MPITRNQILAKLNNAVTAWRGREYSPEAQQITKRKYYLPPDKAAKDRVTRWIFRYKLKNRNNN